MSLPASCSFDVLRRVFQLARRKADELEDFTTSTSSGPSAFRYTDDCAISTEGEDEPAFPPEVVDEGTKLVEEVMREWSSTLGDGDVVMMDVDDEDAENPAKQLEKLRECFAKYQSRLEGNAWVQHLLSTLS